ncbi:MAG: MMPL family transporter [Pirellulaceae bacterium]
MPFPKRFFSRRIPVFYNVAMLMLCIVFFLLPFGLRGARMAVSEIQNNVADWLPKHFEETVDLVEFRKYFLGDAFVVVSGPWCKEGNSVFNNFRNKVFEESLAYEQVLREQNATEIIRAHKLGDQLGLMSIGTYHEDWGQYSEKWLRGKNQKWYFVNRKGELYEWDGQNNVVEGVKRFFERMADGRNRATGKFIDRFGPPADDDEATPNPFYTNPELLFARPFKTVLSGPDALAQMAGPNGTLRIGDVDDKDAAAFEAFIEGHKRLTGALFGPTPPPSFKWTYESLLQNVDDRNLLSQLKSAEIFRTKFDEFIKQKLATQFDNDMGKLLNSTDATRLELWLRMWDEMGLTPPARQTCLIVTINDPFLEELDRIVGSDWFGKPRGRLLELAVAKCGLASENVHFGGPPSDNVAIDEEGSKTLLRLASLSGLVGVALAYYSFRSVRATMIMFFVGVVSAVSSLGYVWFLGSRLDAILMTMPSLIYVLAMSGAVHLINYYRDARQEVGHYQAVDIAVRHGWFPSFLCVFTTAIGLFSLCTSNLAPIWKFGFFSGIATLATLVILYTYVPAALTIWPPDRKPKSKSKADSSKSSDTRESRFWAAICEFCVVRHRLVLVVSGIAMLFFAVGITKMQTTVQLLQLFDKDSKVLKDYTWMESNLGKLVPMEIIVNVDQRAHMENRPEAVEPETAANELIAKEPENVTPAFDIDRELKFTFLERLEASHRVRRQLENIFGPNQLNIVGAGMSSDVFVPMQFVDSQLDTGSTVGTRYVFNARLVSQRDAMIAQDYLAIADKDLFTPESDSIYSRDPNYDNREMWRISLRLAALVDVDYGKFVNDLKMVVEPIMSAYRYRTDILGQFYTNSHAPVDKKDLFVIVGRNPDRVGKELKLPKSTKEYNSTMIDQTYIFSSTLDDLLENRGVSKKIWIDPIVAEKGESTPSTEKWAESLKKAACVIFVEDSPYFDLAFAREHAPLVIDCRSHKFGPQKKEPFTSTMTAMNRKTIANEDVAVTATYTGIVPIVYKAQGALLYSLIQSMFTSFLTISPIMMVLLRDWRAPFNWKNALNFRGGLISMIPNVFPLILVFGFIGYVGFKVDIGSMMTASVALGIAVDDTIHFLTWYRYGLSQGLQRLDAIRAAYKHCASAMLQTSLIGGIGLSVFALSTFVPTQRFGILMLVILLVAVCGDLLVLPAILASRLGKYFGEPAPVVPAAAASGTESEISLADNARIVEFPKNHAYEREVRKFKNT